MEFSPRRRITVEKALKHSAFAEFYNSSQLKASPNFIIFDLD